MYITYGLHALNILTALRQSEFIKSPQSLRQAYKVLGSQLPSIYQQLACHCGYTANSDKYILTPVVVNNDLTLQ